MEREGRFIEIDLVRGIAIAFMVAFHFLWDLDYYGMSPLDKQVYWYSQVIPIIFFILVGMCLVLSAKKKTMEQMMVRGAIILLIGCIISVISTFIIPDKPVAFGVLHCIGLSMILGAFFIKMKVKVLLYLSMPVLFFGLLLNRLPVEKPNILQLIVGLHQEDLSKYTVDYFPMLPWFGIVLVGMALCGILYKDGRRQFPFPDLTKYIPAKVMSYVGKHSLTIYLAHQPIIAGTLLYVVPYVTPFISKYI
jgi:uncharacterized membrane protein